jgi:glucose-1-phosphate cytidylyltransferase
MLRPEIFDYLNEGEDLVENALVRLVSQGRVFAYSYKGYWSPADTVKERVQLEEMYERGNCPWMIWDKERSSTVSPPGGVIISKPSDTAAVSSMPIPARG